MAEVGFMSARRRARHPEAAKVMAVSRPIPEPAWKGNVRVVLGLEKHN